MIPRDVLDQITPHEPAPEMEEQLDQRERAVVREDALLLRIATWCEQFRRAVREVIQGGKSAGISPEDVSRATAVGYGILDWYGPGEDWGEVRFPFPVIQNYRLGVSIYRSGTGTTQPSWTTIDGRHGKYPVAVVNVDFTQNAHPRGGCSAALIRVNGDASLLTARHVVDHVQKGRRVRLCCQTCPGGCFATMAAKAPGYIDAATLKVERAQCISSATSCTPMCPCTGLAIRNHFASTSGYVQATIMQGFEMPDTVLNPVRPRNFMTSEMSVRGDSGSAVSTDPAGGNLHFVGVHLGVTDIEVAPGNIKRRSYALDIEEALRVFSANFEGGFFK